MILRGVPVNIQIPKRGAVPALKWRRRPSRRGRRKAGVETPEPPSGVGDSVGRQQTVARAGNRGRDPGSGTVGRVRIRWQGQDQRQRLRPAPVPAPDAAPALGSGSGCGIPIPQTRHYPRLGHQRARLRGDTVPTAQNAHPSGPLSPRAVGKQRHPRSNGMPIPRPQTRAPNTPRRDVPFFALFSE